MAWNEAMGRPKAKRPSAYSRAMSSAACAPPTCSKATSTAARSSRRSRSAASRHRRRRAARPARRRRRAARASAWGPPWPAACALTPAPARSTRKSDSSPPRRRARAATIAKSATSPSSTGRLRAVRPCRPRRASSIARAVGVPGPSARARQPIASPWRSAAATAASAPRCRRAGAPRRRGRRWRRTASGARLAPQLLGDHAQLEVAEAGAAVRLGNGRAQSSPSRPCRARARRRTARRCRGSRRTRVDDACSARNFRAWSRSAFWSGEKSKFTVAL